MPNPSENIPHKPVLYREVIETFKDIESGYIIDCTMGYAGHSSMILESNPNIKLIGIDQDETAINFSTKRLEPYKERVIIKKGRFSDVIKEIVNEVDPDDIHGILADIGVSSLQLDQADRGFSYNSDTLDMRMDKDAPLSAKNVLNDYTQSELERIFFDYGECKNGRRLADIVVKNRPFHSAKEFSEAIKPAMYQGGKIHFATLPFQAIRIEVNDELGELKRLLEAIKESKISHAKVAIISFHSLEDRIVKQEFTQWAKKCICDVDAMRCTCGKNNQIGKILVKKPIMAQADELKENPRSRSSKMRVFYLDRDVN